MRHKKFWFRKVPCLLVSLLLMLLAVVSPTNALSAELESENTAETSSEVIPETESTESAIETEESEDITYANSISGMLWLDANKDGTHDVSEQPVVEYIVSLYAESETDNAVQTTVTDADGTYSFSDITPGNYVVGIASATVDGQEYLLPLVGIVNDNKFAIASDYVNAYSEPISVSTDTTVTEIDAGMRIPPRVATMDTGVNYIITCSGGGQPATQDTLYGVKWYITAPASEGGGADYGPDYTIEVQGNVSAEPGVLDLSGESGLNITITSAATTPYTITFAADWSDGGIHKQDWAFKMGSNNNLTLTNITLNGKGWDTQYGGIAMTGGTLTMNSGSTLQYFYSKGAVSLSDSTFNMSDSTIEYNIAGSGAGVYLNNSTFTMGASSINHNQAYGSGGGVFIEGTSEFIMHTGEINDNEAYGSGAGVYINSTKKFTMNGGAISNNQSTPWNAGAAWGSGGGVCVEGSGGFDMMKGTIGNNTTVYNGGGVFLKDTTFTMTGGSIGVIGLGNKVTTGSGGGVYLQDSTFNMSGGGTIAYNEVNYSDGRGGGVATGKNSIFGMTGGTISNNTAPNGGGVFITSESWDGSGNVYGTSKFTISGADATIKENTAFNNGGGVYVTGNSLFDMKEGLIDNNTATDGSGGGVYVFYQDETNLTDGSFALSDGIISNNHATGTVDSKGGGIAFYAGITTTLDIPATLSGGTIGGGNEASIGGGISVMNSTGNLVTLNIAGTTIGNNKAISKEISTGNYRAGAGGGVANVNNDEGTIKLTINADTCITGNESGIDGNGGGVYCDKRTSFEMSGGLIVGNTATGNGGGVCFSSGDSALFEMHKGTISNNESSWEGGGLYIGAVSAATIDGSAEGNTITISGNKTPYRGGGISFQGGKATLTITDAEISHNEITQNWGFGGGGGGGGVHCGGSDEGNNPSIKLNKVVITGNSNTGSESEKDKNTLGGGIYMLGTGTLTVSDSTIDQNISMNYGGGIYVGASAKAELIGSIISSNEVVGNGGGINIAEGGEVTIYSGEIRGNKAPNGNGGGINVEKAPVSYSNLTIYEEVVFIDNVAQGAYQPPEDVHTNSRCSTITNFTYSKDEILDKTGITLTVSSPLNNFDINLVLYRIKLTPEDPADWSVLGNVAATFTSGSLKQTAIFSNSIEEYRGYPEPGSNDNGIEMLPDGTWHVTLNLPDNNYTYEVRSNGKEVEDNKWLVIDGDSVNFIEIIVTKKNPLWGKWIYKFN